MFLGFDYSVSYSVSSFNVLDKNVTGVDAHQSSKISTGRSSMRDCLMLTIRPFLGS